jgi:adiponectin receptor
MVLCAKIDYVGIAWYVCVRLSSGPPNVEPTWLLVRLISGSVGTVVYYGFQCNTNLRRMYLLICMISGLIGAVVPFWDWFNGSENKVRFLPCPHVRCSLVLQKWRIIIFLSMTFLITLGPLTQLSLLHSVHDTAAFIRELLLLLPPLLHLV